MDYIEAFKNLRTNNKWGRRFPHKAVLMLSIINLYEQNLLADNEIYYDDSLKSMFLKVWNNVFPEEPLSISEAYLPFWYLQGDSFWHIVPERGKEDILSLMRDTNIKPSESKLEDCVRYAELDEDLYFLMTLPSGRSSLKRTLLETYTNLNDQQIDRLSESYDNAIDNSAAAISEYEKIISGENSEKSIVPEQTDSELVRQFLCLNEDVQIVLNLQYFSFLKTHRSEREMFKEVFPTVYDLFDKIVNNPFQQSDVTPSFAFTIDNFLSDLKIALMGEDDSMNLIDKIEVVIDRLRGSSCYEEYQEPIVETYDVESSVNDIEKDNRNEDDLFFQNYTIGNTQNDSSSEKVAAFGSRSGKPWTREEEELITSHFNNGIDICTIASIVGRTEGGIKARLAKLGLIEYTYGQEDIIPVKSNTEKIEKSNEDDFRIENTFTRCSIFNKLGEKVFSSEGKLKYLNGKLYRFNLKNECFTLKSMLFDGSKWQKGVKKIVAYPRTDLFRILYNAIDYCEDIEDIDDNSVFEECRLKVAGEWYCYNGTPVISIPETESDKEKETDGVENIASQFTVKIGETLKIFPSQMVGKVVDLRIDKSGHRKIVVQAASGKLMEIYDSKYLYQKQPEKADDVQTKKKRVRIKDAVKDIVDPDVAELPQNAHEYDEPSEYESVLDSGNAGKSVGFPLDSSSTVIKKDTHSERSTNKKVRIGDRIKIKNYNASCRVIRIESFAASFSKLIVEFDDGRQDWIIDNPDLYTIV